MKLRFKFFVFLMGLAVSGVAQLAAQPQKNGTQPIPFIQNNGQWKSSVHYRTPMGIGSVFLEDRQFTFVQYSPKDLDHVHHLKHENPDAAQDYLINGHAWSATFLNANPKPISKGADKRTEYHNYFIGNDKSKWASRVPIYNKVQFYELYSGINLIAYSANNNFKYDFLVKPGSNPASIQMQYNHTDGLELRDGKLITKTSVGEFIENTPYVYQVIDGKRVTVACNFVLEGNTVSFEFPNGYDKSRELVIDPELVGATLSGSTSTNYGHCATYDNDENIYTGAISFGTGYPTEAGSFQTSFGGGGTDIAVSKINQDATTLIYATYLGGGGSEYPHSMVVNNEDELYVFGTTQSLDYPVSDGAFDTSGPDGGITTDIVVSHLNVDGTDIIGSTFVGGDAGDGRNSLTSNYGDSYRGEIIVDDEGNCYIASCTSSEDFPTTAGAYQETYGGGTQDAVVFSLNNDLSEMNWSSFVGSDLNEGGLGLRLDYEDNIYICGVTSGEFITGTGYQTSYQGGDRDAFILRLTEGATAIEASSYWGTTSRDAAFFMDLDNDGNVYIYGQSNGGTSEVTEDVYENPGSHQFIAALTPDLADLELATVVGAGGSNFVPIAFMVDACGYIYFSGHSASGALPLTPDALYETGGFYLGVLEPGAVDLTFATLYSGNHVDGGTSRFDPNTGIVYQAVCISGGFTTTPGAHATTSPSWDVGVFKIDFGISHVNAVAAAEPSATGCIPFEVDFENESTGLSYLWDFGDGSPTTTEETPSHTFTEPGVYEVMLVAFDPEGCLTSDTTYLTITVGSGETPVASFDYDVNCATGEVTVTSTGTDGVPLIWDMGDGTIYEDEEEVTHTYGADGTYTITLTAGDGVCADVATASEDIIIGASPVDILSNIPTCYQFSDGSVTVDILDPDGDEIIEITDAEGNVLNAEGSNTANTLSSGWYYYYINLGDGCEVSDSVFLADPPRLNAQLNVFDPLCHGDLTGVAMVDTVLNWQGDDYEDITYIWAPDPPGISGQGADSLYNLGAGDYTLTINDENGCSRVFDFTVTEPTPLEFSELGFDPAYCRQFDYQKGHGRVYAAAVGGTPDYEYEWTNLETGETTVNTTWGALNPGDYEIVITDHNGCTLSEVLTVDSLNPIADFDIIIDQMPTDCDAIVPVEVTFQNNSKYFSNVLDPNTDTTFRFNYNHPTAPWIVSHDIDEDFTVTYEQSGTYEICLTAYNNNGCENTLCKELVLCNDLNFDIVNVFSPNGDNINDQFTFVYRSEGVREFTCVVVNRWGNVINEFNSITDSWDGTDQQGNPVPEGVYFYKYEGKGETGEEFSGQGTVQLLRK